MKLVQLFNNEDVQRIQGFIKSLEWRDGASTASGSAKDRKRNQQITESDSKAAPLFDAIKNQIYNSEVLKYTAFPRSLMNLRLAKYGVGDFYGWHVDQAVMSTHRSDISFTIFLTDDRIYEGGELEIGTNGQKILIKGKAGQIFFYSTGLLHQVRPVTKGERIVIVGWMESLIPSAEDRDSLAVFYQELGKLREELKGQISIDRFNQVFQAMIRIASR